MAQIHKLQLWHCARYL